MWRAGCIVRRASRSSQFVHRTLTYPTSTSSYRLKLQYDYANGIPTAIKDFNAPTTVIWSRAANDARGDVIDETLGANLKVITGRDPLTGRMDYRQAGLGGGSAIQNLAYVWDNAGNLTQRGDANQAGSCSVGGLGSKLCETFSYDNLDRLDTVARNGTQTLDANYDLSGNLTSRSDVGSYSYHATKKHAVIAAGSNTYAYDANGNVTARNGATLGWASYDLPTSLVSGGNSAQFAYAPDRSRYQQTAVTAGVTETTLYIAGLLERVTKPSIVLWKHYVTAPTGVGAVYVRRSDGTSDTYYVTTDHLGSTDKLLKAASGTVQVAESFAPFGARRGSDWQGAPSAADLTAISNSTPDGFTGHEMLDGVGLIHMGGRVYDPAVGRFLSVDPIVRDAAASQSWNGYGYVEGRTLSWTDPDGWSGRRLNTTGNVQPVNPPPPPPLPTGNITTRTTHHFYDIEIVFRTTGDFMSMSGGRGSAASFGSVNEAQEVDREPQVPSEDVEAPQTPPPPCGARGIAEPDSALAVVSALATVGTAAQDAGQLSDRVSAFNSGSRVLGTMTQGRLALGTLAHSIDWLKFNRGITYISLPVAANQFMNGWQAGGAERIYATGDVMFGISAVVLFSPGPRSDGLSRVQYGWRDQRPGEANNGTRRYVYPRLGAAVTGHDEALPGSHVHSQPDCVRQAAKGAPRWQSERGYLLHGTLAVHGLADGTHPAVGDTVGVCASSFESADGP